MCIHRWYYTDYRWQNEWTTINVFVLVCILIFDDSQTLKSWNKCLATKAIVQKYHMLRIHFWFYWLFVHCFDAINNYFVFVGLSFPRIHYSNKYISSTARYWFVSIHFQLNWRCKQIFFKHKQYINRLCMNHSLFGYVVLL